MNLSCIAKFFTRNSINKIQVFCDFFVFSLVFACKLSRLMLASIFPSNQMRVSSSSFWFQSTSVVFILIFFLDFRDSENGVERNGTCSRPWKTSQHGKWATANNFAGEYWCSASSSSKQLWKKKISGQLLILPLSALRSTFDWWFSFHFVGRKSVKIRCFVCVLLDCFIGDLVSTANGTLPIHNTV